MRQGGWLFPGLDPIDSLSTRQLNRAIHAAANDPFVIHRSQPIRKGLACRRKIHEFGLLGQQKIGHMGFKTERHIYGFDPQMGVLARLPADSIFKSP
jgi:hypothetical protein